MMMMMMIMQVN